MSASVDDGGHPRRARRRDRGRIRRRRGELFREEDGRLYVEGETPTRALAERLDIELEGHHETTVGGYLSAQLGRVPDIGEVVECHGHRIEILAVTETRITKVAVVQ